jgi:hypothetical protein
LTTIVIEKRNTREERQCMNELQQLEPVATGAVISSQAGVVEEAKRQGHELGEWKWDGHNSWRAWCKNTNCTTFVYVRHGTFETGGNALATECWLKWRQRRETEEKQRREAKMKMNL